MHTELADMEKEVKSLNGKKATTINNIPTKLLKYTFDICGQHSIIYGVML